MAPQMEVSGPLARLLAARASLASEEAQGALTGRALQQPEASVPRAFNTSLL